MRRRPWLVGACVAYVVLLVWVILWKLQVPYTGDGVQRVVKLVPYLPGGGDGGSDPVEGAMNVVLFIPVGSYLALLAPAWRWWKQLGAFAGASLVLEVTQYALATGSSDVTDVIDNALGGMIGVGLLTLARRRSGTRADAVTRRVLVIVTGLVLLAAVLLILSPIRFHDPHH